MLHVYTGDGKGKTTASVGMALRACGHGMTVIFCQFMKNGDSGELKALEKLGVMVLCSPPMRKMTFQMTKDEWNENARAQNEALDSMERTIVQMKPQIVVLDELCTALSTGMIPEDKVRELIESCGTAEVAVTGRDAPEWLVQLSDYCSVIQSLRHPFEKGIPARIGIEW